MKEHQKTWLWIGAVVIVVAAIFVGVHLHSTKASRLGGNGQCNSNYSGTCVPNVNYDIDCKDIKHKVKVVGKDVYHFDADGNGVGCESY